MTHSESHTLSPRNAMWSVLATYILELRRQDVIDDTGLHAFATAMDSVQSLESATLTEYGLQMQELLESHVPATYSGIVSLGLMQEEWKATATRLLATQLASTFESTLFELRTELVNLAEDHLMTLMPVTVNGRVAQPTMLGHLLGGTIEPLATIAERTQQVVQQVNRSPLGAGMMIGAILPIDRERAARTLGFADVLPNTFDAVSNIEDFMALGDLLAASLASVGRLLHELGNWLRENPNSLIANDQLRPEPSLPALAQDRGMFSLADEAARGARNVANIATEWRSKPYGPLGSRWDDLAGTLNYFEAYVLLLGNIRTFLREGFLINRASLGNRAGRGNSTVGDVAAFLMEEEQLPPSAAKAIAGIVASRLADQRLEAGSVTQEMVDSAALMIIGREVKVEIERLGRYLAPRRYLERRQVTGSAAMEPLRAWLQAARASLSEPVPLRSAIAIQQLATEFQDLSDQDQR